MSICQPVSHSCLSVSHFNIFYLLMPVFSFLLPLTCSEKPDTKAPARANQVRPREVQAKKQQSATLPASSKPAGGTGTAARHRDVAAGAKKTNKTTGKAAPPTQAKVNPRNTNNSSRVIGKCEWTGLKLVCQSILAAACCPAWKTCLSQC